MKRIAMYSIGVAGLTVGVLSVAPGLVNAQGPTGKPMGGAGSGYQRMIETKAKVFGLSTDELQAQLKTKTMLQLAEENGISEDQLHEAMEKSARARWVERGFSQAEIDSRLQRMEERHAAGHEVNSQTRGMGMGRHGSMNR